MTDKRRKNVNWVVADDSGSSLEQAQLAVLMDIRDELQRLNGLLHCPNFTEIPHILRRVAAHTAKPKPKKKAKEPS